MSPIDNLIRALRSKVDEQTRLIYAWELPSIMRKHILTGAMGSVYFVLFSGIYLVTLGNEFGLQYWQWGLLSAASSFALTLQLASAALVTRTGSRKTLWYVTALLGRMLRALAVAVAFALSGRFPGAARAAFIGLLVLANCVDAFAAPPWFSWLADIIPEEHHGRFMGRRSAWIALGNICILVPIGYGIDKVSDEWRLPALMAIFAFAFAMGVLDLVIHRTIPEPPMSLPPARRFWKEVAAPFLDPQYKPWLVFNACWTFSMTLGGSLATIYFVEDLGVKRNFLGGSLVLIMLPMIGTMLAGRKVGELVDRYGVKRMLFCGHLFWAILPAFWILATPQTALWWLAASALTGSISSLTAMNAANKLVTRLPESAHVAMYVAVSTCVGCLAGGMGPLLGGFILNVLKSWSWVIGAWTIVGFHVLFVASLVLRLLSAQLIRNVVEPPSTNAPTESDQAAAEQKA